MPAPLSLWKLIRWVATDLRQAWQQILAFAVAVKLAEAWFVIPFVAAFLAALLAASGATAVSNFAIVTFLLSPVGLVYAALFAAISAAIFLVEQAGVMAIAATYGQRRTASLLATLWTAAGKLLRIGKLGAMKVAALAALFLPFALLGFIAYFLLLTEHDLYFYLKTKPRNFWLAAALGGLIGAGAAGAGLWLFIRWSLALPIVLFENEAAVTALRTSRTRVHGCYWMIAQFVVGWHLLVFLLGFATLAGFRSLAQFALNRSGEQPILIILLLLAGQAVLVAAWSMVALAGHALLIRRLYLHLRPATVSESPLEEPQQLPPTERKRLRLLLGGAAVLLFVPLFFWTELSRYVQVRPPVGVTAHRGHARAAPENTLSALRKAMESGADYAEIDVQLTSDGVIVLLHDRDLKRVAGDSRRLSSLTFAEVRQLDVGSWFSPAFAGERVPSLAEAIDLCRGKLRLHIELKVYGGDRAIAPAVADLVRREKFENESIVASLDLPAVLQAKQQNPDVRTALIVAQSLGDLSRLDLDVLSVRADFLTDALLRAAHRRGMEVHAWTVNDPAQMRELIKRGVDNILTSDPDLLIRVRDEWEASSALERLLEATRLLLGLPS